MNKDQFNNKFKNLNIHQKELDRKYHVYLREQQELQMMMEAAQMLSTTAPQATVGGGGGGNLTVNAVEFIVNTSQELNFRFDFTSTDEPIEFTIDWGDGNIHEDSGAGGFYTEEHTYDEAGEYTVKVTFDDPLKVLELNFPGWDSNYSTLVSITDLQYLANLQEFRADYNSLVSVDFSGLTNLTYIDISDCVILNSEGEHSLTSVNLTGCISLEELRLDDSDFSAGIPDLAGLNNLKYIDVDDSGITGSVDISFLPALDDFDFSQNPGLTELIISSSQPLGFNNQYLNVFNCGLTEASVDAILVALSTNGIEGGTIELSGGTNSAPSSLGLAAKTLLEENGWTVYVNEAPPSSVSIAASTDFDIIGDFTIEMFVNMSNLDGFPRPYSFGVYPAPNAISLENDTLHFWANGVSLITGSFAPTLGDWYHICVMGSDATSYMFINGVEVASSPYEGSISSQELPLTIGYGNENNTTFNGLISNFRWTSSAVYDTTGFTVPTTPLTDLSATKLLIFQGNTLNLQLTDNSGNNHNATNDGANYSALSPFEGVEGSLQLGTV